MADEIEKKYRLTPAQKEQVLSLLTTGEARFEGEDFEENILFDGGGLREKQAVLRLRRTERKTVLTYKERVPTAADYKHYREYETEVADFPEMASILESLGYRQSLVYEKRRKTFSWGNAEIVVDELPFGDFMEIEGAVADIDRAENFLSAGHFEVEPETYPHLTARFGVRREGSVEARFS